MPPTTPVNPALAAPTQPVETAPIPDLPKLPEGEIAPLPKPAEPPPPVQKPEEKKPAQTKPVPQKQTQKTNPKQKSQQAQLPVAASTGAMEKANPITLWQLAVIKRLQPYMRWPDDAPYWIDTAAPHVRITIDRQGHVLRASVVQSSGYESFDKAARKIFKWAATLPPAGRAARRSPDLRHGGHLRPAAARIGLSGSQSDSNFPIIFAVLLPYVVKSRTEIGISH